MYLIRDQLGIALSAEFILVKPPFIKRIQTQRIVMTKKQLNKEYEKTMLEAEKAVGQKMLSICYTRQTE